MSTTTISLQITKSLTNDAERRNRKRFYLWKKMQDAKSKVKLQNLDLQTVCGLKLKIWTRVGAMPTRSRSAQVIYKEIEAKDFIN